PDLRCGSTSGSRGPPSPGQARSGKSLFERRLCRRIWLTAVRARALPAQSISGGGFGRGAKPPSEDLRDGRCANLAEPDGKERVEQRSGADERRVHALPQEILGALDGRNPADGEQGAVPRPR